MVIRTQRLARDLTQATALVFGLASFAPTIEAQDGNGREQLSSPTTRVEAARLIVAPGAVLEGDRARLLIRDGLIVAVGSEVPDDGPTDATVVRFEGATIAPGFVLPHHELGAARDLVETIDAFTPHLRAAEAFDPFAEILVELARSGVTTVGLAPSSRNTFPGRAAVVHTGEEGVLHGDTWLKVALVQESLDQERYPTSRMGAVDLIRRAFVDAADPLAGATDEMRVLREVLTGNLQLAIHARSQTELRLGLDLADELSLRPILLEATDVESLLTRVSGRDLSLALAGLDYSSTEEQLKLPAKLQESGVPFSFLVLDGQSLRRTMHLAIQNGLDPDAALAAGTTTPALQLGVDAEIGSLRKGRRADLCVFDGAPYSLTSRVLGVWTGGNRVSMEEKESN